MLALCSLIFIPLMHRRHSRPIAVETFPISLYDNRQEKRISLNCSIGDIFPSFHFFSFCLFFLLCVDRHFYSTRNWLSSSYTRIQFISSSVRHTQLNGNMVIIVNRRKELIHTLSHAFFLCV